MLGLKRLSLTFIRKQKEGVKVLPEGLIPEEDTKPADAKPSIPPKGTIPEGTVLGDGKNQIRFWLVLTHVSSTVRLRLVGLTQLTQTVSSLFQTLFVMINFVQA